MIERSEDVAGTGKEAFLDSLFHQDAALRNLPTLTETTQRRSTGLKSAHPQVEWVTSTDFWNVLVHDHAGIDIELV